MIRKSVIVVITLVALISLGFAAYVNANSDNHDNNSLFNQTPGNNISNNSTVNNTSDNGSYNNTNSNSNNSNDGTVTTSTSNTSGDDLISAADAQTRAGKYILEPGAQAGTPTLKELNGEQIYVVPVILNGEKVGTIDIDANTGANVGGEGGA